MTTYQISTAEQVTKMVRRLKRDAAPIGFDIETTGLNARHSKVVMMQLGLEGGPYFVVDVRQQTPMGLMLLGGMLAPLFDGVSLVLGMNLTFDLGFMWQQCGVVAEDVWDIMLADLDIMGVGLSESHMGFDMKSIAARYGNTSIHKEERNWFIDLDKRPDEWLAPFPQAQVEYGVQDIEVLFDIYHAQVEKVSRYKIEDAIRLDMGAVTAVTGMQTAGVPIDEVMWRATIDAARVKAQELASELQGMLNFHILAARTEVYDDQYREYNDYIRAKDSYLDTVRKEYEDYTALYNTGEKWGDYKLERMRQYRETHPAVAKPKAPSAIISLTSSQQLRDALNHMQLKNLAGDVIEFHSVKEAMLVEYSYHPVIEKLLEWKKLEKLVVGFGDNLMAKMDGVRLFPQYNINGAGTGRMSGYNPNFQQIPSKSAIGKQLREAVRPLVGRVLVACDFSNIELRILAEVSKDRNLLAAFATGEDVHSAMARMIFHLDKDIDPKETQAVINGKTLDTNYRAIAKTVTYAVLYGAGPSKLASVINGSIEEAKGIIEEYFGMFVGIKAFKDGQANKVQRAIDDGKHVVASRTMGGRRRPNIIPTPPRLPAGRSTKESRDEYDDKKTEYRKEISRIKRRMVNSPIQGTSADITKLALALWQKEHGYDNHMRLIAVVHDELLVEADSEYIFGGDSPAGSDDCTYAEIAATDLASVMHEAMTHYLKKVECPMPDAVISDHWKH